MHTNIHISFPGKQLRFGKRLRITSKLFRHVAAGTAHVPITTVAPISTTAAATTITTSNTASLITTTGTATTSAASTNSPTSTSSAASTTFYHSASTILTTIAITSTPSTSIQTPFSIFNFQKHLALLTKNFFQILFHFFNVR